MSKETEDILTWVFFCWLLLMSATYIIIETKMSKEEILYMGNALMWFVIVYTPIILYTIYYTRNKKQNKLVVMMSKERKIIKVPIPKEIWDADMSLCNRIIGRDIVGAWMKSVLDTVKQCDNPYQR